MKIEKRTLGVRAGCAAASTTSTPPPIGERQLRFMPVQEEEEEEEAKEEDEEEKEARPCPRAAVERAASPLALSDDTGSTAMSLSELEKYSATALCNSVAASSCPRQAFFMNAATCSSYFFFFIDP